jgi:Na+-transporting methylmalonyl-CoA/oxaloacetate decarboxylase gamma subunit
LTDFQTGLMISAVGLLVTFSALGIFIGVMVLLQKIFPVKKEAEEIAVAEEKTAVIEAAPKTDHDEIAAALAAVTFLRSQRAGQLGSSLLTGPGPYRTSR